MTVTTDTRIQPGSCFAYGAAAWAAIFAVLHVVWAAGWHVGLEADVARRAFAQPLFLAYDITVAVICVVAAVIALALVRPWGGQLPRWLVGLLAIGGTGLLLLRSAGSVIQVLYQVATGTFVARPMHFWEIWFYIGAFLFGMSTWKFWAARATPTLLSRSSVDH